MADNLNYSTIPNSDPGIVEKVRNGKIKNSDIIIIKRLGSSPNIEVFWEDKSNSGFEMIKLGDLDSKNTKIINQTPNIIEIKGSIYDISHSTQSNVMETIFFKIFFKLS